MSQLRQTPSHDNLHPSYSPGEARNRGAISLTPVSTSNNLRRSQGVVSQTPLAANPVPSSASSAAFGYSPANYSPLGPGIARNSGVHSLPPRSQGTSPTSAMAQPYNPQQWGQERMGFQHHSNPTTQDTRSATGMEAAMPSPPPPYSPDDQQGGATRTRPSPMLEQMGFTASPRGIESTSSALPPPVSSRMSPRVPMSPSFPPPPPPTAQSSRQRERSANGQRLFTTIQTFANRGKQPVTNDTVSNTLPSHSQSSVYTRPPASRRAASAGHIGHTPASSASGLAAQGRDSPDAPSWQPGMPLPGPPPGPPPAGSRSQSLNRFNGSSSSQVASSLEAPQPKRRLAIASTLGPVPPTPANWEDDGRHDQPSPAQDYSQPIGEQSYQPLRIDTGNLRGSSLTRRPASRGVSAQGLRERRSRSKAARDGNTSEIISPDADDVRPGDQISPTISGAISQRREHARKASTYHDHGQQTPSAGRPESALAHVLTPPYTPAVGDQPGRRQAHNPLSASSDRPLSHDALYSAKVSSKLDPFSQQSLERHRSFIEKESAAASDAERLEIFANYIVHESRLRRDRYHTAFNAMAGDIVDLTRDLWRSHSHTTRRAATPSTAMSSFDPTIPSYTSSDGLPSSAQAEFPRSGSSLGNFTPATESGSMGDPNEDGDRPESSRQWGESFKPCLSPIPSMAVSSVQEGSSRGRTPSRWWEHSEGGTGSIGKPERIEKTHRETKYMGISPAMLRESPQPSPEVFRQTPTPGASTFNLGLNEYPPEKVGWHESGEFDTPVATPGHQPSLRKTPDSIASAALDVSRLVTLPPPYPRHHPAVNNSHPLLTTLRNEYRQLADTSEAERIRDAFIDQDWKMKRAQQEEAKQRRSKMRKTMQEKVESGEVSFAEAAKAEADFETQEIERGKSGARATFDAFETSVSHPLNNLITEKLATAERCISELRKDLESNNKSPDPNRAQEEGDEHPERLEKLTLLKWIFEARETLHKEMYDLHAQRAERYGEVVLTPYRMAKQQSKVDEAEAFFRKDGRERSIKFAKESLERIEGFLRLVERNVTGGVEDQLSAFWDIAPGLREVVQHIPGITTDGIEDLHALDGFDVMIPSREYEENPAYQQFPLQYLYSLLSHAEKSAYQFIESQTNLLCMLHEVRGTTAQASLRLIEVERSGSGGQSDEAELSAEMAQARSAEERRLTADLQEKVGEVERQWDEALGERLDRVKAGVKKWLEEAGGWEDGLGG